jgi:hypothetical protein
MNVGVGNAQRSWVTGRNPPNALRQVIRGWQEADQTLGLDRAKLQTCAAFR